MLFSWRITVAKGYPTTAKERTLLRIARGVITRIEVKFPPGCAETTHIQICRGSHQLYPANPDSDEASDNETVMSAEQLEIPTPPYHLVAWTWNTSIDFDHTLTVRIEVLPKKGFIGGFLTRR